MCRINNNKLDATCKKIISIMRTFFYGLATVFMHTTNLILHSETWLWVNVWCLLQKAKGKSDFHVFIALHAKALTALRGHFDILKKRKNSCEQYLMLLLGSSLLLPVLQEPANAYLSRDRGKLATVTFHTFFFSCWTFMCGCDATGASTILVYSQQQQSDSGFVQCGWTDIELAV